MGKINVSRVILGGLLAGVVFVLVEIIIEGIAGLLGVSEREMLLEVSDTITLSGARYHVVNIVYGVVFFIFAIGVYAAIRPRFGAGPKTALITALGFWFLLLLIAINFVNMDIFPVGIVMASLLFNLLELPPAILAGARIYKEEQ
jgi:hypothetical protein